MNTEEIKKILITIRTAIPTVAVRAITDLVTIESKNGKIYFSATDRQISVIASVSYTQEFPAIIVRLSFLLELLKQITIDNVELENKGKYLLIKGNGNYKIPKELDDNGNEFTLSINISEAENKKEIEPQFQLIKKRCLSTLNKAAFAQQFFMIHEYKNGAVVTDTHVISFINAKIGLPYLTKPMLLATSCLEEKCQISENEKYFIIKSGEYIMSFLKSSDTYPVEIMDDYLKDYSSYKPPIIVDTKKLLAMLKRQQLFKEAQRVTLKFSNSVLTIKDLKFEETLDYEGILDYNINMISDRMIEILKIIKDDKIKIYAHENGLMLEDSIGKFIIGKCDE